MYKREHVIKYYSNPQELINRLELIIASVRAGNSSNELKNEAGAILDKLQIQGAITRNEYKKLYSNLI